MNESTSLIPVITDDDIAWVGDQMHLTLDDERKYFLKCQSSIDVAACPGSGKTTLVVAKLAILARKWPYRTKGICVLSHTNVAREEIESRLGTVPNGYSLLNYPHFIGTIHAFANRFLGLPYLRSLGISDVVVDDILTHEYRKKSIDAKFYGLNKFLQQKHAAFESLRLTSTSFDFSLGGKDFPAGPHTPSFNVAKEAVRSSAENGYFCFDEMFVWAHALINKEPTICTWLANRFPLVIIDEVQDTNQKQGMLLRSMFPTTSSATMQRIGDDNQAIFNYSGDIEDSALGFPQAGHHTLSKSFRFGQEIADFAAPFAKSPVQPSLAGCGPQNHTGCAKNHTIFIFPKNDTSKVLQSFGELVLETFNDEQLWSKHRVMAVGSVHNRKEEVTPEPHHPKYVSDYWQYYSPENSSKKEYPRLLLQYFFFSHQLAFSKNCIADSINKIASGIVRMCKMNGNNIAKIRSAHQAIISCLKTHADSNERIKQYNNFVLNYLQNTTQIDECCWENTKKEMNEIFEGVFDQNIDFCGDNAFLKWHPNIYVQETSPVNIQKSNVCVVEKDGRQVNIHLDSIHGVKGQTHLATLLLDTYYNGHFFKKLLTFLLSTKCKNSNPPLEQAYVAMTRPTHLLCLAIPDSSFGGNTKVEQFLPSLLAKGWRVQKI